MREPWTKAADLWTNVVQNQLKSDLARSELAPRKKSFVQAILRRRREAKAGDRSRKYVWLGAIITVFGLVGAALRQLVNRAK